MFSDNSAKLRIKPLNLDELAVSFALMRQLKQDYSRQVGPREQRPACQLFNHWLTLTREFPTDLTDAAMNDAPPSPTAAFLARGS